MSNESKSIIAFESDGAGSRYTNQDNKNEVALFKGKDGSYVIEFYNAELDVRQAHHLSAWAAERLMMLLIQRVSIKDISHQLA